MSRILADKITNYNNDGPIEAEQGISIPLNKPIEIGGSPGVSGQYLSSTGSGLSWQTFPDAFTGDYNDLLNKPYLFSGDYGDLVNRPNIPSFNLINSQADQYLRYNGSSWVNTNFPEIYTYTFGLTETQNNVEIRLVDNENTDISQYSFSGSNGIVVSLNDDVITIESPTVVQYNSATAVSDVATAFLSTPHNGITFDYDPAGPNIIATVLSTYNLSGSSNESIENDVTISLLDGESNPSGFVNLIGTGGINIAWDTNSSSATFSYVEQNPYTLPTASTVTQLVPTCVFPPITNT